MGKVQKKKQTENLYLEDRPTLKDEFYYQDIANTLKDTIKEVEFPTHIGLMGTWGSGKSTVLKLTRNILKDSPEYGMKTVSVWKFSDNSTSLHRNIIKQIRRTLGVKDPDDLDAIHNQSGTSTQRGLIGTILRMKFSDKRVRRALISLFMLQSLVFVILGLSVFSWITSILTVFGISAVTNLSALTTIYSLSGIADSQYQNTVSKTFSPPDTTETNSKRNSKRPLIPTYKMKRKNNLFWYLKT
ncbi:P-loop NTPase fold protein [Salibacterium salarium]|uniref:P-loop NTPase fold protein n=1 Tax=Salibacterium salarium TaxID=284579 RepID=UPI00163B3CE1|nr:P-loop NTPase fold protein [Salibacterium salarium]